MDHVQYAYVGKPSEAQVANFVRGLVERGISVSHLGQNDPPRKFRGSIDEVARAVLARPDRTAYTFARDAARKLELTFEIHDDPRWTHSTVSASGPDLATLTIVAEVAATAFDSFITIRGVSGGGKEQAWEVVHITERCPDELRSRFVAAS